MARNECDYCEVDDIKLALGDQWTGGAVHDRSLEDAIEKASRQIDEELGWGDCHFAAGDNAAVARLFDTQSGCEMEVDRCLDDGLYYTALTISFAAPNLINDAANGLVLFLTGDVIAVSGSALNDGVYTITTGAVAGQIVVTAGIVLEAAGASITISRPAVAVDETATGVYVPWAGNVDYITWPYNQTYFTRIKIKTGANKVFPTGQQLLRLTGKWGGVITPPAPIKKACVIMVAKAFKRGMQMYQDTGAIEELGQLKYVLAIDPEVTRILSNVPRRVNWG